LVDSVVLVGERFQVFCLRDPVQVALQVLLQLLLLSQLLEVSSVLRFLSFFGELTLNKKYYIAEYLLPLMNLGEGWKNTACDGNANVKMEAWGDKNG
jgi:hypothetical protein